MKTYQLAPIVKTNKTFKLQNLGITIFLTLLTFNIMAQKEINTSIEISAAPEAVWNVLTNFSE